MPWVQTAVGEHLDNCSCARCSARQGWDGRARIDAMTAEHERRMAEHDEYMAGMEARHAAAEVKYQREQDIGWAIVGWSAVFVVVALTAVSQMAGL